MLESIYNWLHLQLSQCTKRLTMPWCNKADHFYFYRDNWLFAKCLSQRGLWAVMWSSSSKWHKQICRFILLQAYKRSSGLCAVFPNKQWHDHKGYTVPYAYIKDLHILLHCLLCHTVLHRMRKCVTTHCGTFNTIRSETGGFFSTAVSACNLCKSVAFRQYMYSLSNN